jgi:plasmid stabilization system protein ParE
MYKIIYETTALDDLEEIVFYYVEQGGLNLADNINNRIHAHIKRLENMPFRSLQSQNILGAREFLIEKLPYRAYFLVDDEKEEIHVLNIVHTARKYPNQ